MSRALSQIARVIAMTGLVGLAWLAVFGAPGGRARAGTATKLYVDSASRACSDARAAAAAASPATPMCSIARAIAAAPAGATVLVRGGRYPAVDARAAGSGRRARAAAAGAGVTVAATGSARVAVPTITVAQNSGPLTFQGLTLTGGSGPTFNVMDGAHDIQLLNSTVQSSSADAILLRPGVRNVVIAGNTINSRPAGAGGGGNGISFASTSTLPGSPPGQRNDPPISNVTIANNKFPAVGTDAIRPANFVDLVVEGNEVSGVSENGDHNDVLQSVFGGRNLVFRNNYIHDNAGQGLFIKDGQVTGAVVQNNVFVHNTLAWTFQIYDTIGLIVTNNTVWDNEANVILRQGVRKAVVRDNAFQAMDVDSAAEAAANVQQDYNLIAGGQSWGPRGPHDIRASARFVNAAAGDYRLAAGSPGIDAGSADGAAPFDKACRARFDAPDVANRGAGNPPFVDMGALEYSPASGPGDTAAPFDPACAGGGGGATPPPAAPPTTPAKSGAPCCAPGSARGGCKWLTVGKARRHGKIVRLRVIPRRSGRFRLAGRVTWRNRKGKRHADLKAVMVLGRSGHARTVRLRLGRTARNALIHRRSARLALAFVGMSRANFGCALARSVKVRRV